MNRLIALIVQGLMLRAMRTPYFHLFHADGTLYMARYWLVPFAGEKEGCYVATWRQPFTWLLQKLGVAVRIHDIRTADLDRALHDHPWTFASLVLRGYYIEERPERDNVVSFADFYEPMKLGVLPDITAQRPLTEGEIDLLVNPPVVLIEREPSTVTIRRAGSFALRRFHHRHRITEVSPGGVWTLFISFRKQQTWGFFTPKGKVWWWEFESVHNNAAIK